MIKIKLNTLPNVPNKNGTLYPDDVLENAIKEYMKLPHRVGGLKYYGSVFPLDKAAFEIINIEKENDSYIATIKVLETPEGKRLKEMIEVDKNLENHKLCSIGFGELKTNNEITDLEIGYYSIFPKDECA